jgi:hypothetical protein
LADGTRPRLRGSFVVYVPSATGQLTAVSRLRPFICNLDLCSAPHSKSARRLLPATEYYICARARLQAQFIHHRSHISRSSILSQLDLLLLLRSLLLRRRSAQLSCANASSLSSNPTLRVSIRILPPITCYVFASFTRVSFQCKCKMVIAPLVMPTKNPNHDPTTLCRTVHYCTLR